jgi:hypothetical protein
MIHINYLEFDDLFEAWKGSNIWLAQNEHHLCNVPGAGGIAGPQLMSYNNLVRVKSAKTYREDWDIGAILGYTDKKWSSLVNNYLDMNYLDLIRNEVNSRTSKSHRSYNYSYHFRNKHGSGKDCLVALNFSRRIGMDYPVVVFTVRTSEVTRRLIFDFLMVQRIIEYVYPEENRVELHFQAPSMYIAAESFVLFNNEKSIEKIIAKVPQDKRGPYTKRILDAYKELSTRDPESITWKVHQKSARYVQNKNHARVGLTLGMLQLKYMETFPKEIVSKRQRNQYQKKQQ